MERSCSAFLATAIIVAAQTFAPHFEVVSIKPIKVSTDAKDMHISFQNDRFEATSITLKEILAAMSGFSMSSKIEGGPRWTETDRYDIVAKAERAISVNDRNGAVMSLLEERFKLITHREIKEIPGLVLTVEKMDRSIQRSQEGGTGSISGDRHHLIFQGINMFRLANYLSQIWRTTVEDHTNVPGAFDFSIDLDQFANTPSEQFGDLLRSAMNDLGFILQSRKVTVGVTVIDHAEPATEN